MHVLQDEITAVVLNYRTAQKTVRCLQSVLDAGVRQAVLVDNSEDGGASLALMEPDLAALRAAGMDMRILEPGRNLGFAAGANRGLAAAAESWGGCALLLNSDATLHAGALPGLRDALSAGADIAAPYVESRGAAVSPVHYYQQCLGLLTRSEVPGSFPYVSGACLLLSPKLASTAIFDETFFFYGEDVELFARLRRLGIRWAVVATSTVFHEGSGSARRGSLFYEYHVNRGHWLLARQLAATRLTLIAALAGRLLTLPLRAVCRSLRFRSLRPLRGMLTALLDVALRRPRRYITAAS